MQYARLVDLTLPIVPGEGARPFDIERGRTEEITVHPPVDHPWYVMHRVRTISHIGTHVEAPYHCIPDGRTLDQLRLDELVGEALICDLSVFPLDSTIGADGAS